MWAMFLYPHAMFSAAAVGKKLNKETNELLPKKKVFQ